MDTREKILKYISEFTEVPVDSLSDDTDLVTDIDWSKLHEDERFEIFIDDFISRFKIYIPKQDFLKFANKKGISKILYPFYYVIFICKYREPLDIKKLTVGEIITIVDKGIWDI